MTKRRKWLATDDGCLCLDGYPIRIERRMGKRGFEYRVMLYDTEAHDWAGQMPLGVTKICAEQLAKEIDEFEPDAVR